MDRQVGHSCRLGHGCILESVHGPSYPPSTLSAAAVRLFAKGFRSKGQVCALLGLDPKHGGYSVLWRWSAGRVRPSSRYLRRMARVSMWQLEGYPVEQLTRVDWDGMTTEWESGGPNLFYLSASVVFPFGGPRDATALMHDLVELQKVGQRADLVRLLGLGRHGHSTVYRWMTTRDRRPGPIMTCRVLVMIGPGLTRREAGRHLVGRLGGGVDRVAVWSAPDESSPRSLRVPARGRQDQDGRPVGEGALGQEQMGCGDRRHQTRLPIPVRQADGGGCSSVANQGDTRL